MSNCLACKQPKTSPYHLCPDCFKVLSKLLSEHPLPNQSNQLNDSIKKEQNDYQTIKRHS